MIEFIIIGLFIGFLIGLIPGLHINSVLPLLLFASNQNLTALIVSASISFVFSSSFSTVLFGVPSDDYLLVLPAHKLVKQGQAIKALSISFDSMVLAAVFSFLFIFMLILLKHFFYLFQQAIPAILLLTLFSFIAKNKESVIIIILSGLLGYSCFHFNLLFPLLTGFFAVPNLLRSFDSKIKIQFFKKASFSKKLIRTSLLASFLSSIFSVIPTISSAIASTVAEKFGRLDDEEFISFISSTNFSYMAFSFYALSVLGVARSGSSVFLKSIEANPLFYAGVILFSAGVSFYFCKKFSFTVIRLYQKIDSKILSSSALFFLIFLAFAFNGFVGVIVLFTSSSIGLLSLYLRVPCMSCMSSLIIPTVLTLL